MRMLRSVQRIISQDRTKQTRSRRARGLVTHSTMFVCVVVDGCRENDRVVARLGSCNQRDSVGAAKHDGVELQSTEC